MTNPKDLNIKNAINENCPWSGNPIDKGSLTTYKDQVVGFCNTGCRDKFEKAVDLFDDLIPKYFMLKILYIDRKRRYVKLKEF